MNAVTRVSSRASGWLGAALALVCAGAMLPAGAAERSVVVQIQSTQLASREGVVRVYQKLRLAAEAACGEPNSADLREWSDFRQCVARSLDRAIGEVHDARLTAYHAQRTGVAVQVAALAPRPAAP